VPFAGDSIRHVLTWSTKALPEAQREGDKKIRFFLRNADLYSYLPDQTRGPSTVLWDPAANGGLLPSDKRIPAPQRFAMRGRPSGFRIARQDGWVYADLHSVAALKTQACFTRDDRWTDATDWAVEAWYRVADKGTEPVYGLATSMRPNHGRWAMIYLSDDAVGLMTAHQHDYTVLHKLPMDTTDAFHWYRMVHEGEEGGSVSLAVDGKQIVRLPYGKLFARRGGRGLNIVFGPNAGHCEGRLHVAKFGYRLGGTERLLGPITKPASARRD